MFVGYQQIRLYDIKSNNPNAVAKYDDISKNITAIGFNEEGTWMFSTGEDHAARIWDLRWAHQSDMFYDGWRC